MEQKQEVYKEETEVVPNETCVCNMEWRGSHDNDWSDCVCYPEEQGR